MANLVDVLERIRKAKLKLKPSKCELFKKKISYLGHVISAAGVETDPKKIQVVKEWPVPSYVTDVRAFLGFCNYYRRFFPRLHRSDASAAKTTTWYGERIRRHPLNS